MAITRDTSSESAAPAAVQVLDEREATPKLHFSAASIAVHVLLSDVEQRTQSEEDAFSYHQREFLSYAHRGDPPLVVRSLEPPRSLASVVCRFPAVDYMAAEPRRLPERPEEHRFEMLASVTYFRPSRRSVLTVVLRDPAGRDEDGIAPEPLSEFGVIRLAKLWEGGEGEGGETPSEARLPSHGRGLEGPRWVTFETADSERIPYATLIDRVRHGLLPESGYVRRPEPNGGYSDRPYVTGSVQLRVEASLMEGLARELRELQAPDLDCPDPKELIALSGVLRSLMSFDDTNPHELPSIFRQTAATNRLITAVHKGTFLRIAHNMRMPSAYFLLPHITALHNEALLDSAVQIATSARPRRRARALDDARRAVNATLAECIDPETIHYPNLRALYEQAELSRGLKAVEARARGYADELNVDAASIRSGQQALAEIAIAAVALVFGAFQIRDTVPLWLSLPAAAVVVASILLLPMLSDLVQRPRPRRD